MKEIFDKAIAAVKEFISTSSKLTLTLIGISIFFIVSAVVLAFANIKPKQKTAKVPDVNNYSPVDDFFEPQGLSLTKDYYFYRETQENWSEKETEEWFSTPDEKTIQKLSESNNKIVDDIIGAAP